METKLKHKWVKALRSGEYKQCCYCLHDGEGFCCLGVLADINEDGWWVRSPSGYLLFGGEGNVDGAGYGVPQGLITRDQANKLINLNDNKGYDFNKIADWIEANL